MVHSPDSLEALTSEEKEQVDLITFSIDNDLFRQSRFSNEYKYEIEVGDKAMDNRLIRYSVVASYREKGWDVSIIHNSPEDSYKLIFKSAPKVIKLDLPRNY